MIQGNINIWSDFDYSTRAIGNIKAPHCSNPNSYDFSPIDPKITGNFVVNNLTCAPFEFSTMVTIGNNHIDVVVFRQTSLMTDECTQDGVLLGTPECRKSELVGDPESFSFNMMHSHSTSWKSKGDINVETKVVDAHGNLVREFKAGEVNKF